MSNLLVTYEQQYANISASITAKTSQLLQSATEDTANLLSAVDKEIEEANELLEQMDLEVRQLPSNDRSKYQNRLQSYKAELKRLEKDYKQARTKNQERAVREDLMGGSSHAVYGTGDEWSDQKQSLLENSEKLERGIKRLDAGYKIAVETEEIGSQVLTDLQQQRETISRTRSRLRQTDSDLSRSGRLLNRMIMRILQNRLVLLGVALLIMAIIVIGVYFTVRKHV